ncbi:hypothetical protein B6S59_25945 [Pseudomonas sp. A46]|nr:hypothetical protein B6S59_25945 [Pseudomonas sp. A46]
MNEEGVMTVANHVLSSDPSLSALRPGAEPAPVLPGATTPGMRFPLALSMAGGAFSQEAVQDFH